MTGISVMRRVTLALAAALVVVLVAGLITTVTLVRRPLPSLEGEYRIDGLSAEVEVLRDERGIPQIYADTSDDLFMAQGYVHAQDRFFEMDYRRHLTAGRLAELVGPAAVEADTVIRTMGWRIVAEEEWEMLSPQVKDYLQAYADGVNAYLEQSAPSQLALEYAVLGLSVDVADVEPWSPVDSLAWLKAMAWDLLNNYDEELQRAAVYGQTGSLDMVSAIFPDYPTQENLPILPSQDLLASHTAQSGTETSTGVDVSRPSTQSTPDEQERDQADSSLALDDLLPGVEATLPQGLDVQGALDFALQAMTEVPTALGEGDGLGSNSWVIAGEHTESGEPLLANDPHLGSSAPGIWYQVGLHCRTVSDECPFGVSGFSFAGLPGVVIGHNDELAWGLTNMGADAVDFFLERIYPDGTYLYDEERVPLVERREVIGVNGGEDVAVTVRSTDHGPIISDVVDRTSQAGEAPLPDGAPPRGLSGYGVALSWTALQPGRTVEAIFAINTATDAEEMAEAAALFEVPSQNIVFATTDGDIGYQAPGRIPVRDDVSDAVLPTDGTWPRLGWDPRYDWQGYVEAEDMPAQVNPDEGFIVASNQPVLALDQEPFLAVDYDYGYRSQRIRELITEQISEGRPFTTADMNTIQVDEANPYAELLVPVLQEIDIEDPFIAEAVDLFEDWDGRNTPDSAAAAYFSSVWANLLRLTFWDQMPASERPNGGSRWLEVISHLLEDEDNPWWDDRATLTVVEQRDEILHQALHEARIQLTVALGKDTDDWEWGRLHQAAPVHPVLGEAAPGPIRSFVNPSPIEVGGGSSIVNANSWNAAAWVDGYPDFTVTAVPSMRMVVDMADFDASTWVNFTGNSGHPAAGTYDDQFEAWAQGETFDWAYHREAVEEAESNTLVLRPPM